MRTHSGNPPAVHSRIISGISTLPSLLDNHGTRTSRGKREAQECERVM
jgi:hypothetical protein